MAASKVCSGAVSAVCLALGVHGCSADGTRPPNLLLVAPEPAPPAPEPEPDTTLLPPAQPSVPPSSPLAEPEAACATVSAAVEFVAQPVDIIVALDNSGSMDDEARAVEANINLNFAQILQDSGVDYRLILISEHRERDLQDTAVCILSPLSTLSACPSAAPGPSERFFQYSIEVGSDDSFDVLLETFDGREEDDFGLAPGGWSQWLRPDAKKVFLEITDDDADGSAGEFLSALTTLAPDHFGADPARPELVWHSIVGLAEQQISTEPYVAADPVQTAECDGDVFNAGTTYQELSRLTGGLRFPICQFGGYDAVFARIASDVVQGSSNACDFAVPEPPPGAAFDLDKVAVSYSPGSGGEPRVLGRVLGADACGADAFFVDDVGVHLCAEACDVVSVDASAGVDVLFTCQSTLLR